jgi:hypothetical protein
VRARVAVGLEDPAPVHDRRVPLALFGVDGGDLLERLDGCDWAGLGASWGSVKVCRYKQKEDNEVLEDARGFCGHGGFWCRSRRRFRRTIEM